MNNIRLHELTSRIDRVFISTERIDDEEAKSNLSRYLCILTSGYIEESIRLLIRDYTATKASPKILNHINLTTKNQTNFNCEKIEAFLSSFDSKWRDDFENSLTFEERDAINSVIANRHLIAHGQNVGISYINVKSWYKAVKNSIEKIQRIINS